MQIHVTEHKSRGTLRPIETTVRVFVDHDYHYGHFVPEHALFAMLTEEQQRQYLATDDVRLEVTPETAQRIIDIGHSPYKKVRVA